MQIADAMGPASQAQMSPVSGVSVFQPLDERTPDHLWSSRQVLFKPALIVKGVDKIAGQA